MLQPRRCGNFHHLSSFRCIGPLSGCRAGLRCSVPDTGVAGERDHWIGVTTDGAAPAPIYPLARVQSSAGEYSARAIVMIKKTGMFVEVLLNINGRGPPCAA